MKELLRSTYFKFGLTIFIAGSCLILLFEAVNNWSAVGSGWDALYAILSPFVYGLIMAYLLCPVYNAVVRRMYHLTKESFKTKKQSLRYARIMATIVSLATLFCVVGGLFALIIPETIRSITGLVQSMPERVTELVDWITGLSVNENNPEMAAAIEKVLNHVSNSFLNWAEDTLLPSLGDYMSKTFLGVWVTLKTVLNLLIGVIVCVYFLNIKETLKAQTKKSIIALCSKEHADGLFELANYSDMQFGGFINGKIIDSAIIGVLCFILMSMIGLPYTVLVSTIVGITNIIPFFGPFIGAIPGTLIILLESPIQAFYFVILILALQQFDGNILGPKILGESTGISPLMVVVSITIGGGFFGFMGMFLGVPTFAVISYLFRCFIHYRLKKKGLPPEHKNYIDLTAIDYTAGELHYCTPAASSLSGKPEPYTKQFKASAPEDTTFSQTVHETELELQAKQMLQPSKGSVSKKAKNKQKNRNNTGSGKANS